jgi:hypothetical protein
MEELNLNARTLEFSLWIFTFSTFNVFLYNATLEENATRERENRHKKCKIEIFSQHIVVSYLQSMLCSMQEDIRFALFSVCERKTEDTNTTESFIVPNYLQEKRGRYFVLN